MMNLASNQQIEALAYKEKRATAMLPGLLKRFWTFDPDTLILTYTRKSTDDLKKARLVTNVVEDAEDIAPRSVRKVPCTKIGLRCLGGRKMLRC